MNRRLINTLFALAVLILLVIAGVGAFWQWRTRGSLASAATNPPAAAVTAGAVPVRVSQQARKNLQLTSKPLQLTTYWRKIEVPAVLTDFPGVSDRGVVAPVTGVVTQIFAHPGETVEPAAPLFSLRLVSESLHTSQRELFKAAQEIEISQKQRERLSELAQSGALPLSRIVEIDNQIQRANVNVQAYRQDLKARGLSPEQVEAAAKGEFVTEIVVRAPVERPEKPTEHLPMSLKSSDLKPAPFGFELQDLRVELGQQVEAGQVLCKLADHRLLLVEGRGFKDDLPHIQQAAKNDFPIEVRFEIPESGNWPPLPERLHIHHVANAIDPESRTFAFDLILENQWQSYARDGRSRLLWRFRPGDRARLFVAVEKLEGVFVLPKAAIVRDGPEAYVFRQNGDLFDRRPVHVVAEDGANVVIAPDESARPGFFVGQNAAESLNRVLKAQAASGMPANVHVHADGTVHAAH